MGETSAEIDQESPEDVAKAPELVSDPDYFRFVHAAGNIPEIVQKICDEGFACEGDLLSTSVVLPPQVEAAKNIMITPHKQRKYSVVISLPKKYLEEIKTLQKSQEQPRPFSEYFLTPGKTVKIVIGQGTAEVESRVIDPCFIEGYFSTDDGRLIKNPNFSVEKQQRFKTEVIDGMLKLPTEQETTVDEWWLKPEYQAKFDPSEPRIP